MWYNEDSDIFGTIKIVLFSVVLIIVNEKIVTEMCQLKRILEYLHVSMFLSSDCIILKNFRCKKNIKTGTVSRIKMWELKKKARNCSIKTSKQKEK